jgi:hypothetical protein
LFKDFYEPHIIGMIAGNKTGSMKADSSTAVLPINDLRDNKKDEDFMSDETYYGKFLCKIYKAHKFRSNVFQAFSRAKKEQGATITQQEEINDEKITRDPKDKANCEQLFSGIVKIKDLGMANLPVQVFYDIRWSDFIIDYGGVLNKHQLIVSWDDLRVSHKNLQKIRIQMRQLIEKNFVKKPNAENQMVSTRELERMYQGSSKRSLTHLEYIRDQHDQLIPRTAQKNVISKMKNFPVAIHQYTKYRIMRASKENQIKLVWRTIKLSGEYGFFMFFYFESENYVFHFKAVDIDSGEVISEALMGFEDFILIFD